MTTGGPEAIGVTDVYDGCCAFLGQKCNSAVRNALGRANRTSGCGPRDANIDLSRTYLGPRGLLPLIPVFADRSWLDSVVSIDMSGCGIGDAALAELVDQLAGRAAHVTSLVLDNNDLSMSSSANLKRLRRAVTPTARFTIAQNPCLLECLVRELSAPLSSTTPAATASADADRQDDGAEVEAVAQELLRRREAAANAQRREVLERRTQQLAALAFASDRTGHARWHPLPMRNGWLCLGVLFSLSPAASSSVERRECVRALRHANRVLCGQRVCLVPVFLDDDDHDDGDDGSGAEALRAFLLMGVSIVAVFASEHASRRQVGHWAFAEEHSVLGQRRRPSSMVVPLFYRREPIENLPRVLRADPAGTQRLRDLGDRAANHCAAFGAKCMTHTYGATYAGVRRDGALAYRVSEPALFAAILRSDLLAAAGKLRQAVLRADAGAARSLAAVRGLGRAPEHRGYGAARALLKELVAGTAAVAFLVDDPLLHAEMKVAAREAAPDAACVQCRLLFPRTLAGLCEALWSAAGLASDQLPSTPDAFVRSFAQALAWSSKPRFVLIWDLDCVDCAGGSAVQQYLSQLVTACDEHRVRVIALMDGSAPMQVWIDCGLQVMDHSRVSDRTLQSIIGGCDEAASSTLRRTSEFGADTGAAPQLKRAASFGALSSKSENADADAAVAGGAVTDVDDDAVTRVSRMAMRLRSVALARIAAAAAAAAAAASNSNAAGVTVAAAAAAAAAASRIAGLILCSESADAPRTVCGEVGMSVLHCALRQTEVGIPLVLLKYAAAELTGERRVQVANEEARRRRGSRSPSTAQLPLLDDTTDTCTARRGLGLFTPDIGTSFDSDVLKILAVFGAVIDWAPLLDHGLWAAPLTWVVASLDRVARHECAPAAAESVHGALRRIVQCDALRMFDRGYPLSCHFIGLLGESSLASRARVLSVPGLTRAAGSLQLDRLCASLGEHRRAAHAACADPLCRVCCYHALLVSHKALLQRRARNLLTTFVVMDHPANAFFLDREAALRECGSSKGSLVFLPHTACPLDLCAPPATADDSSRDESLLRFVGCAHAVFCFVRSSGGSTVNISNSSTSSGSRGSHRSGVVAVGELAMFLPLASLPVVLRTHASLIADVVVVGAASAAATRVAVLSCTAASVVVVDAHVAARSLVARFQVAFGAVPLHVAALALGAWAASSPLLTPAMAIAGHDSSLAVCGVAVSRAPTWHAYPVARRIVAASFVHEDVTLCTVDCAGVVHVWGAADSPAPGLVLASLHLRAAPLLCVPPTTTACGEIVVVLPGAVVRVRVAAAGVVLVEDLRLPSGFCGTVAAGDARHVLVCDDLGDACLVELGASSPAQQQQSQLRIAERFCPARRIAGATAVRLVGASMCDGATALRDADSSFHVMCDAVGRQLTRYNNFAFSTQSEADRCFVLEGPTVCFTSSTQIFWWKTSSASPEKQRPTTLQTVRVLLHIQGGGVRT